jgi:GNAT superfamily N-acetyltransferase
VPDHPAAPEGGRTYPEWRRGAYVIRTDPARIDVGAVHAYLTRSYWATGIPLEIVRRSLQHSVNFAILHGDQLAGFGRVITDRATFGYLGDVFVLEPHRGQGLSKWLMECVVAHPELQGFRRWVLLTRDAHGLYRQYGFRDLAHPDRYLERWSPDVYGPRDASR